MFKTVEDIMNENVQSVFPETPLAEAALVLSKYGFNGLPVVDQTNKLVGLFTEHNMVSDRSYVHLKTLLKVFSDLEFYKKDNSPLKDELKNILKLQVKDVMTSFPAVVHPKDSIEQAANLFANPVNNPLPVVDEKGLLRGVLSMSDLTKVYGIATKRALQEKDVDKQIDQFVQNFGRNFLVVSRFRASTWFIASVLFTVVGFSIAMFLILRISS